MATITTRHTARSLKQRLYAWLTCHVNAASDSVQQLWVTPFATALTIAAIAIALALPTALHVFTINLKELGGHWEGAAAISLFLLPHIDEQQADKLANELRQRTDVAHVEIISRQAGLAEFRSYSGLGAALDQLTENPLPVVLALYPTSYISDLTELEQLSASVAQLPGIDFVRLDTEWIQRLQAVIKLLQQGLWLLSAALAIGVLLVIGNTIRLEVENRRNEIEVMDLVGATASFIRRPFLYSGAWYGLFGGSGAWVLVNFMAWQLQTPVDRIARLYHSHFQLLGLDWIATCILMIGAIALGIAGSWLVVAQRLNQLQPSR
ncbi:cell division protein FtsX [Rhodoferax sp. 4810]|uniref:Cell division protein FtsX n=1 Tax=Thiospirillum jenense TaxID=1653858 RepID=A0A839HCY5_9GAMM|nr:permease-like cell division protein FtsX [Thiospirillum jenense]MBB1074537.1 cell division protein FtsX [Rhodoferax jenense]MBB1126511.1 cell division protein FtsX [Thiospirillum jenense]